MRALLWGAALAAVLLAPGTVRAQPAAPNQASFDLYVFSQDDELGQPHKNEGFGYGGFRGAARLRRSESTTLRVSGAMARIANEDVATLPSTVRGATVTSASSKVLTLDAAVGMDVRPRGGPWTWSVGLYYHHQIHYLGGGIDLQAKRELHDGNTILLGAYSLRMAFPLLRFWDGSKRGRDRRVSHTLGLSWTQILSSSWIMSTGIQLVRETGLLSEPYNYVLLHDESGVPVSVSDEALPRGRNRAQANARLRYAPVRGWGVGLDLSGYTDDWDLRHAAVEPSLALPVGERLRIWYRYASQRATRHFDRAPGGDREFVTQDSDLGGFSLHGGGAALELPLPQSLPPWRARISVFGFHRSDSVSALGVDVGFRTEW